MLVDLCLVLVAVLAGVLLVSASGHWWPTGKHVPVAIGAAVMMLVGVGLVWFIRTALNMRRRRWGWWDGACPAVLVLAVMASVLARPSFEDARPAFEKAAGELLDAPGRSYARDLHLGRFDVSVAYDTSVGEVYFHDARSGPFPQSRPGWVYSPQRAPRGVERLNLESIGNGWYRFQNVTVD
jgi:hypothetical protein